MTRLNVKLSAGAGELKKGMREIQAERPELFGAGGLAVRFEPAADRAAGIAVAREGKGLVVRYGRMTDAFRALGRILAGDEEDIEKGFVERPRFDTLGTMIDVSRNAVLRPETVREMLRKSALMGLNVCMLYSEDTYEVPGEPFFGYLRGAYSEKELRALDDYAAALGVEMFPCIQTLAHLEQILQWPAYRGYRDTDRVVLADYEPTYALIEKMIRAASAPFRSKRIHLGMDEAQGIGMGRYREMFGDANAFEILNRHLRRVKEMCDGLGLKPLIWSDMYFRIGSKEHEYYDLEAVIPKEVAANIPKGVGLVYWDYYHTDRAFYEEYIERHRGLGSEPVMAGGVWTWNHFWTDLRFSFAATEACMMACKAKGLKEAFVTMWGDDGNECDILSALPGIQFFAEHGYADEVDAGTIAARYRGTVGGDFDAMVRASCVSGIPGDVGGMWANPEKWLLWQDPLLSFLDPLVKDMPAETHYGAIARDLDRAAKGKGGECLRFPAQLARVISLKVRLRERLAAAYRKRDRKALKALVRGDVTKLRREVERLRKVHRGVWMERYKPFGWEVIDARYGGLSARLETAAQRVSAFAAGEIESVPELEVKFVESLRRGNGGLPTVGYERAKTASYIK